jgi:hypothetical protein
LLNFARLKLTSSLKDNPEYLRFKYNDNSYQEYLITTGKPKTCTTTGSRPGSNTISILFQ